MRAWRCRPVLETFEPRLVPTVYQVGPGHPYAAVHDVPWDQVGPGDVVQVFWKSTPYHDKIDINTSGTAAAHILIQGVPGPQGQHPVIDANGAIEDPEASYYSYQIAWQGAFTIAPSATAPFLTEVQYIDINGFEIANALRTSSFTDASGNYATYNYGAAGVAMYHAEHISITNCYIHDNEDGLFGKSDGYDGGNLVDIYVAANWIIKNGVAQQDHYHNTYIEAVGITYEFNYFGPPVQYSAGLNVKDRSAGLIFRYNRVEGGNTMLDLVDPEDGSASIYNSPLFGSEWVYGNVLINPPGGASAIVHFGGDTGVSAGYQRNLYFYNNTIVDRNDYPGGRFRTILFYVDTNDQHVYAANNIFFNESATPGVWPGNWCIAEVYGTFYLGVNWINNGYLEGRDGLPFEGVISGEANLITGSDPGFVDDSRDDFTLAPDSPCLGVGMSYMQFDALPVEYTYEYNSPIWWVPRATTLDLGTSESGSSPGPAIFPPLRIPAAQASLEAQYVARWWKDFLALDLELEHRLQNS